MGFESILRKTLPNGPKARSKMEILRSEEGALIKLQHCDVTAIKKTDPKTLRYGHTGFHRLVY